MDVWGGGGMWMCVCGGGCVYTYERGSKLEWVASCFNVDSVSNNSLSTYSYVCLCDSSPIVTLCDTDKKTLTRLLLMSG